MSNKKNPHLAFSIKYKGIAKELVSEAEIINPLNNQRNIKLYGIRELLILQLLQKY